MVRLSVKDGRNVLSRAGVRERELQKAELKVLALQEKSGKQAEKAIQREYVQSLSKPRTGIAGLFSRKPNPASESTEKLLDKWQPHEQQAGQDGRFLEQFEAVRRNQAHDRETTLGKLKKLKKTIQELPAQSKESAYRHGIGLRQYTTAWLPIKSQTHSAKPVYSTGTVTDEQRDFILPLDSRNFVQKPTEYNSPAIPEVLRKNIMQMDLSGPVDPPARLKRVNGAHIGGVDLFEQLSGNNGFSRQILDPAGHFACPVSQSVNPALWQQYDRDRDLLARKVADLKARSGLSDIEASLLVDHLATYFKNDAPAAPPSSRAGTPVAGGNDGRVITRAAQAAKTLTLLSDTPLLEDLKSAGAGSSEMRAERAWAFANSLVDIRGGKGMDLLDKLTDLRQGSTAQGRRPPLDDSQRSVVMGYFLAARQANAELTERNAQRAKEKALPEPAPAQYFDPKSVFYKNPRLRQVIKHAEETPSVVVSRPGQDAVDLLPPWPGRNGQASNPEIRLSLAEKALLAVPDSIVPTDPNADPAIHNGFRWAIHAMRAGFTHDEPRNPDGSPSDFFLAEQPVRRGLGKRGIQKEGDEKTNPSIERIKRYLGRSKTLDETAAYNDVVAGAKGMGIALSQSSPLATANAMQHVFEITGELLSSRGGHRNRRLIDADGMCRQFDSKRHAMNTTTPHLEVAQKAWGSGFYMQPLANLVRHEVVATISADQATPRQKRLLRGDDLEISPGLKQKIFHSVMARIPDEGVGSLDPHRRKDFEKAVWDMLNTSVANCPLTAPMLLRWSGEVTGHRSIGVLKSFIDDTEKNIHEKRSAVGAHPQLPLLKALSQHYDRIQDPHGKFSLDTSKKLQGEERGELLDVLAREKEGQRLGSEFELSAIRNRTFTSKGVTQLVSSGAFLGTQSYQGDFGHGRRKGYVYRSVVHGDRNGFQFGHLGSNKSQWGGGASAGPQLGVAGVAVFGAQAGVEGQDSWEWETETGTSFGYLRPQGSAGDEEGSRKTAQLLRVAAAAVNGKPFQPMSGVSQPCNPEDQLSPLKAVYQAGGHEVVFGNYEIKRRIHDDKLGAKAAVGAAVGKLRFGVYGGIEGQLEKDNKIYRDLTGPLRAVKKERITTYTVNLKGTLGSLATAIDNLGGASQEAANGTLTGVGVDAAGHAATSSLSQLVAGTFGTASAVIYECQRKVVEADLEIDGRRLDSSWITTTWPNWQSYLSDLSKNFDQIARDKAMHYFPEEYEKDPRAAILKEKIILGQQAARILQERDITSRQSRFQEWSKHENDRLNELMARMQQRSVLKDKVGTKQAKAQYNRIREENLDQLPTRLLLNRKTEFEKTTRGPEKWLGMTRTITLSARAQMGDFE